MPSPAEDEPTAAPEVGDVRPTPVDVASAQRRPSFWNAYRHALAGAHVRSGLLAGQVWAFGAAMVPLGVLLLVRNHDSLAFRSVVLGAMTLTTGLGAPVTARWVARAGGRRPLTFLGCANALALAALVGSMQLDAPRVLVCSSPPPPARCGRRSSRRYEPC